MPGERWPRPLTLSHQERADVPGRHLADVVRHIMIKKELQQRPGGGGVGLDSPGAHLAPQEPVATMGGVTQRSWCRL